MPKLGRRSEVTELDYQVNQALTTRDAPFGTDDTPNLTEKIIGGKYVPVLERPYAGQNTPRYEKLSLVSDKPNHVDPRALTDFSRRYNKPYLQQTHGMTTDHNQQDPFAKNKVVGRPTNTLTRRPDSKDISSRYPTLPPIEEHRLRNNHISTVFEPEAWTQQHRSSKDDHAFPRPFNSSEDSRTNGIRPLYDPAGSGAYSHRNFQSQPAQNGMKDLYGSRREEPPLSKEEFVKKLAGMLPKNVFLPDQPLILSEADEVRLLEVIGEEMGHRSPLKLRDIYLDIANSYDKTLSGYCQYQDLYYSMNRQMFSMPGDLLQVTSAMFVSQDRPNRDVNYEKFLSYVGMALKQATKNGGTDNPNRPRSPVEQQMDNYFANSEQAKLISMMEQQLKENDYVIDFPRLQSEMTHADRIGKGVLDLRTIMDVCYQQNIPLQSSVLNRVLQKCRLNNYDDKYSWRMFMDLLSKAQPPGGRTSPVRFLPPQSPQRRYTPPSPARKPATPLWRRSNPPHDPRHSNTYDSYQDEQGPREEVISRLEQDIKQLERNYGEMKDKLRPKNDTPWFKNFMEFANALYKQDQRHDGDLPAEDVYKWTKMYNETGNLDIPDHFISKALSDSSKNGKVNIHSYLTKLGNVANNDKIF